MKTIEINPSQFGQPNQEFKDRFNKDIDICELSDEVKRGVLFFMGAYLPGILTKGFGNNEKVFYEHLPILGLYSSSTCNFSDYGELNDHPFSYWIYNTCTLLASFDDPNISIDGYLRKIDGKEIIIGKRALNQEFLNKYKGQEFKLNLIQKINNDFFQGIGKELLEKEFILEKSYEAGMAYRMMMLQMDLQGTQFLINLLSSSFALSPLYRTLLYMPTLFYTNKHAFEGNHLFSQILNSLAGGIDSKLMNTFAPIHRYHQFLFYKEGTNQIREEWQFEKHNNIGSGLSIYLNAIGIRNTGLVEEFKEKIDLEEVYYKEIINKSVTKNELIIIVLQVVKEKYGIDGSYEFRREADGWNDGGWNNKGDYIQFLVALYYETCLHAMVVKEMK